MILNFAKRQQHIVRNHVCDVKSLTEGPGNMRIVSHEEQQRYLAVASSLVHDVALLIVETGMRPEEVFNLKGEDLNLPQRYLKVAKGKTRFARRNIPLTEAALEVLKRRLAPAKGSHLFSHRSDPNRPSDNIDRGHHIAVRQAKIGPDFHLYDFRHTSARARQWPVSIWSGNIEELMGHSTITTTMRYVHPTPEHKRQALEKLEPFNFAQILAQTENRGPTKSPQSPKLRFSNPAKLLKPLARRDV